MTSLLFDGVDDVAHGTANDVRDVDTTIGVVMKRSGASPAEGTILTNCHGTSGNPRELMRFYNTSGKWGVEMNYTTTAKHNVGDPDNLADNTWEMLAGVFDVTTFVTTLYRGNASGVNALTGLATSTTGAGTQASPIAKYSAMGNHLQGLNYVPGKLARAFRYTRKLTVAELTTITNGGFPADTTGCQYFLDEGGNDLSSNNYDATLIGATSDADEPGWWAPTVPNAPTGVTATPAYEQITVDATADPNTDDYDVLRGVDGGALATIASGVTLPYVDTTATNIIASYAYALVANNTAGSSGQSATTAGTSPTIPADAVAFRTAPGYWVARGPRKRSGQGSWA